MSLTAAPIFLISDLLRIYFMLRVRIAIKYEIQDFDVISVGLETRCPVGAKPSVEIQHLRTCDNDGPKRPVKTECFFVAEIPAGAETKEREAPPVSLCPKPKDRIGLLFPCFRANAIF